MIKVSKVSDSFDVQCLDLNLIIIFMKYTKAERCTDIMFKLTLYCLSVTVEDLNLSRIDLNLLL